MWEQALAVSAEVDLVQGLLTFTGVVVQPGGGTHLLAPAPLPSAEIVDNTVTSVRLPNVRAFWARVRGHAIVGRVRDVLAPWRVEMPRHGGVGALHPGGVRTA
ncbi:MAG: hypothetical protein IT305_01740 [Chloroflexi bacterium]|nr:hypothetical protein [Chloroflexota bacterium]